jgi:hypothetical protein
MNATLKKCCYGSCPPEGFSYSPCDNVFKITFTWEGPCKDLDTAVVYDGASSGYDCDNGDNPRLVSGDIRAAGGTETHWVKIPPFDTGSKYIDLYMHWFTGAFTSSNCPVSISITNCDGLNEFTFCTIEEGTYNSCSSDRPEHHVGRIQVRANSTFVVYRDELSIVEGFCLPKSFDIEITGPVNESSTFTRATGGDQSMAVWYGTDTWTGKRRQLTADENNISFPYLQYAEASPNLVFFGGPHTINPGAGENLWYHLDTSVLRQPLTISEFLPPPFEGPDNRDLPGGTYTYTFTPIF